MGDIFANFCILAFCLSGLPGLVGLFKPTGNIYSFSFELKPAKGKVEFNIDYTNKETGVVEGRQPLASDLGGFKSVGVLVNGAISSTATVTLDSTRGIVPGMTVTGTGISGTVTVATVVDDVLHRDITLSSAQTIADDAVLFFESQAQGVEVADIQAVKEDGNIVIRGFLKVTDLGDKTAAAPQARLYVNDFIKLVTT